MTESGVLRDIDLMLRFESLGDNCELGLVQRRVGAEPLGLLRFAGTPLGRLLPALHARFAGIADPDEIRIGLSNDEYMVELSHYGFNYHADARIGSIDPQTLHAQQTRTVRFLADKLIGDLEAGEKMVVFRQNEPLLATDLLDLRLALAAYGRSVLLWVQEARPGHPPGSVTVVDETLMVGHVSRLAPRHHVPDVDVGSWVAMLRKADALRTCGLPLRTGLAEPPRQPRQVVLFGREGNAVGCLGSGWSAQEDGFCWSIDDRSTITLPAPEKAAAYRLEMDVVPYVVTPTLPVQRLRVDVNGSTVQSFDALTRGEVACPIPAGAIGDAPEVTIAFHHPDANSPRVAAGESDDRRLAVAFRRLVLSSV